MIVLPRRRIPHLAAAGLLLLLLMAPRPAAAHKVSVFAWVESGTVHTESKFSGGRRVNKGKIEAFDHQDRLVHEGTTNADGYYGFAVPEGAQTLRIVLTAGAGHTNHWTIAAEELGTAGGQSDSAERPLTSATAQPSVPAAAEYRSHGVDAQTIEAIVERTLDRKLAPIRSQLAQQRWRIQDILAGLGYIIGLMGLASYLHYRKQIKGPNDR